MIELAQKRDDCRARAVELRAEADRLEAEGHPEAAERARENARDYDHAANMYQGTIDTMEGYRK